MPDIKFFIPTVAFLALSACAGNPEAECKARVLGIVEQAMAEMEADAQTYNDWVAMSERLRVATTAIDPTGCSVGVTNGVAMLQEGAEELYTAASTSNSIVEEGFEVFGASESSPANTAIDAAGQKIQSAMTMIRTY